MSEKEFKMPKLDEHAQDLLKHSNFSDEDIQEALAKDKFISSTGEKNMKKCLDPNGQTGAVCRKRVAPSLCPEIETEAMARISASGSVVGIVGM